MLGLTPLVHAAGDNGGSESHRPVPAFTDDLVSGPVYPLPGSTLQDVPEAAL